jgi:hypothetical protein
VAEPFAAYGTEGGSGAAIKLGGMLADRSPQVELALGDGCLKASGPERRGRSSGKGIMVFSLCGEIAESRKCFPDVPLRICRFFDERDTELEMLSQDRTAEPRGVDEGCAQREAGRKVVHADERFCRRQEM